MTTPRYTFLLPAFKAQYFEEALLSIRNQTYTEFLCIVSDDCSPDDMKSVYDKVVGDDPRFSYRRNAENMGSKSLVSHWNMLVDMCQTDYLIMASDDDVYVPEFLQEVDRLVGKYSEVDLIRARASRIDGEGDVYEDDSLFPEYQDLLQHLFDSFKTNHINCIGNYVFKTGRLNQHGGFVDYPLAWFSDDATTTILAENGVANTKDILFQFRCGMSNISSREHTTSSDCWKKIVAAQMYYSFMSEALSHISPAGDKKKDHLLSDINLQYKNRVKIYISEYKDKLNFNKSLILFRWLTRHRLLTGINNKFMYWINFLGL